MWVWLSIDEFIAGRLFKICSGNFSVAEGRDWWRGRVYHEENNTGGKHFQHASSCQRSFHIHRHVSHCIVKHNIDPKTPASYIINLLCNCIIIHRHYLVGVLS